MVRGRAVDMNCLRTLLTRLADAANYWLQTPFDAADELWANPKPRDGADRLAEREAEIEVAEPKVCECGGIRGIWHDFDCEKTEGDALRLGDERGVLHDALFCLECGDRETARQQLTRLVEFLSRTTTSAAPDIRSSVDAADGPRGTAAQPETRAGHPNPQ